MNPEPPAQNQEPLIQHALSLCQGGRWEEAAPLIKDLTGTHPDDLRLLNAFGTLLLSQGRTEEGMGWLEKSLRVDPQQATVLSNYANALGLLGRFDEALAVFDRVIALQPGFAAAHYNRGLVLQNLRRPGEALESYDRAIALNPVWAEAHKNRGNALRDLHRPEEALESYDRALTLRCGYAEAHHNRGVILLFLQRPGEALESLDRAASLDPSSAETHFNRGIALQKLRRSEEALAAYDHAASLRSGYAEALNNRGTVLQQLGRRKEALADFNRAVALQPGYAEAFNNRGNILKELKRPDEALESLDRALALAPSYAEAYNNRGAVFLELGRREAALADFDRAIALQPGCVEAHNNRGTALKDLKRIAEAFAGFDRSIALDPGYAEAVLNKSLLKLSTGDYLEGWRLFEWRWKAVMRTEIRGFTQPLWLGDKPLAGRTILLHAEQGHGDVIQFCRYVLSMREPGTRVILEVPKSMVSILRCLPGDITIVAKGSPLPPFDLQCPMMSLPAAFKTTVETVPAPIPYLSVDPERRDAWRRRLEVKTRPRIGLAWSGSAFHPNDRQRSLPLARLGPLLELPFEFHSLQKEYRDNDRPLLAGLPQIHDHHAELGDYSDTAALISEMDLVVSVDTSVAHLAGALGMPLWILLSFIPDYRWLLDRPNSPWYPEAVLFTQRVWGDWDSLVMEVVDRLKNVF